MTMQDSSAARAALDSTYRIFAVTKTEFTRCTRFDFADKSFMIVWFNGRIEVNEINS